MAKVTALDKARRGRQLSKPKPQSAPIGPAGPKHPGNRQLYDKRGRPDAGAWLHPHHAALKVATFCAALWSNFALPLTHERYVSEFWRYITTVSAGILNPRPSETRSVLIGYFGLLGLIAAIR